ncbi:hypothetical protein [Sphingobacterium sp. xlx-130]|uniref:hypothetical protein n=1 Tax=Sphingobacterium sp. xlx-130 TaxID=2654323 RepID=UPI0013DA2752|nr:hypothetical protein [Sphingobacterium sp. xlx-130]
MTIKEAILLSLEDIRFLTNHTSVTQHIIDNGYYDFKNALTPKDTVSAELGNFIRKGDARVKRINRKGGTYAYYLTKYESQIQLDQLEDQVNVGTKSKINGYSERNLHKLLASFLKASGIYTKTIFHEQSNMKDNNQVWTHPDMVGIDFLKLKSSASQNLLKSINKGDTFKLRSYELKRVINTDNELKQAYFQAVSNSSWANYGYLVAFEIGENLQDELDRLNQSFGIGVILLTPNPYLSKILYPARYKDIDFKTLDKLCIMNSEFSRFIGYSERLLEADERYHTASEKEFNNYCDHTFENDSEIEEYCIANNIPYEKEML